MIQLTLSMIIWGTLGVFVLWSGIPAIDVAFYRCLLGAILIACVLFKSKEKIKFNQSSTIVAIAGLCLVLNWIFLFKSFQVSNITIGNMSYYLQPIMLMIMGIFIYKEKVSSGKWFLIGLALIGLTLTIDLRNFASPNIVLGVIYALAAALLYSILTLLMKRNQLGYYQVIFIQLMIGVLLLLPFIQFAPLSYTALWCMAVIGIVHTLLAYFLYYQAIKKTTFTQIAVLSYLDPIVAIVTDVIFFNRELNIYQLLGVGLTFMSLYFLVTASRSKSKMIHKTQAA